MTGEIDSRPPSPFLFSPDVMGEITEQEERGIYTAERLFSQRPEIYQATVELLGRQVPVRQIARILHIHHRSVAAVRMREPEAIDTARLSLGRKCGIAATLMVESIIEDPDSVPKNVRGLVAAQLIDKAQLLGGGATSRPDLGRKPGELGHEDFEDWIKQLPSAAGAGTGFGGENGGQMAEADPGAAVARIDGPTDGQSVDLQDSVAGDTRGATCGVIAARPGGTDSTGPADAPKGGGGGQKIAGGLRKHTG